MYRIKVCDTVLLATDAAPNTTMNPEVKIAYSVVVPVYNEEKNVEELHRRILEMCTSLGRPFEILFVDDGSKDLTLLKARSLSPLTLIALRKNFGQTAALDAGFKQAKGDIIVTLDGDLQNDPKDIPLLLAQIEAGYDVVSGWRFDRQDPFLKRLSSRGADILRKILFKDSIHDSGCALKAYRRDCLENLDLYGEMHRFIPAILEIQGFRITEVKVSHHPRLHGESKYNWRRYLKSVVDMISVWFWANFAHRPLHLFGGIGLLFIGLGGLILLWMAFERLFLGVELAERVWPLVGTFLALSGLQMFTVGIITDILMKSYYRGHDRMNYSIRDITTR